MIAIGAFRSAENSINFPVFFQLSTINSNRVNMDKRSRPPQGYYKSLETSAISRAGTMCESRPEVIGVYQTERIVVLKFAENHKFFK